MKCENCQKLPKKGEPLWTSRKADTVKIVCADCLYKLDGFDHRGKSGDDVLKELRHKRLLEAS